MLDDYFLHFFLLFFLKSKSKIESDQRFQNCSSIKKSSTHRTCKAGGNTSNSVRILRIKTNYSPNQPRVQ